MKDRTNPCVHYTFCGGTCQKGIKDVSMTKCSHCEKYRPRKSNAPKENMRTKRQKDRDRHDQWKKEY